jgi:hypothetical protein
MDVPDGEQYDAPQSLSVVQLPWKQVLASKLAPFRQSHTPDPAPPQSASLVHAS